jgi:hypothetical protein
MHCILLPANSLASYLTLAWDPNTEPDLAGYRVYYGTTSGEYVDSIDVGNITTYRLDDLLDGVTYFIALTAYDTSGNESDFSHEVSGIGSPDPTNDPPAANAGPDQTVDEGVTVTLDASNSSDPDDGIASYLWEQTAGIGVTLSDPTAVRSSFTSPVVGPDGASLTFRLTVTDNGGLQSTDTCIVNVTWENDPPAARVGPDQTVEEGVTVTLDGSNSSDSDDGIASYLWEQSGAIAVALSDPTAVQPSFTSPDVGPDGASFTFRLTVTDNGGLQSTDTCIVNVTWENDPPAARAGPDQTVDEGITVALDASNSSDPDDGIASYLWEQTAGNPVTLSDPTEVDPTFVAPSGDASEMLLSFRVTLTDNGGLQAADEVSVTVHDTSSSSPPSVQTSSEDGYTEWGCFIATAAYGSLWEPHVRTLRDFRDHYLTKNQLGKSFIRDYYRYSPFIAQNIETNPSLKAAVRISLTPLVLLSQYLVRSTLSDKIVYLLFVLCYSLCIFSWLLKNHPDI